MPNLAAKIGGMVELRVAHTADMQERDLVSARALLDTAFDDFDDDDWEHALGGMHATLWEGSQLVAHASVVQRRLLQGGRALRAGYVEAVAVRADARRQGYGSAVMGPLERIIANAYDLGALGASEEGAPFYAARGWQRWRGATYALTPHGTVRTPDEDRWIFVLQQADLVDPDGKLTCDWRDGDVW